MDSQAAQEEMAESMWKLSSVTAPPHPTLTLCPIF